METVGAVVTVMVVLTTATVMTMVTVIVEEAMEALTVSMARVEEVMIVSSGSGDVGGGNACKGGSVNVDEDNMREGSGDGGLEVLTAATVDEDIFGSELRRRRRHPPSPERSSYASVAHRRTREARGKLLAGARKAESGRTAEIINMV